MKKETKRGLLVLAVKISAIAAAAAVLFTLVVAVRIIHANDMYPSVRDGQLVLISRLSPVTGDSVVLYRTPEGTEQLGRVIASGGQEVDILEDSGVSVDGSIIYQTVPYETPKGTLEYPLRIAEGSYFLLNDYRENRNDSRSFGAIPEEDITGVVIFTMQYRGF